jgi:transposase
MFTLGFDVAKDHVDIALTNKNGQCKQRWQVDNTVTAITAVLQATHAKHSKLQVGCEATGYYHLMTAQACRQLGLSCYVLNPLMTKQYTIDLTF